MSQGRGSCPKCGSTNVSKDQHELGADTGDRICNSCGYIGPGNKFKKSSPKS